VYEQFCEGVSAVVAQMRQGPPLHSPLVDCGALCMPQHHLHLQRLVDDAVSKGATVLAGGKAEEALASQGQFYPPTVLADVTEDMLIMQVRRRWLFV
jgi:succinate-semialdehyde dehydrogenase / glutarate-semialdehyde dehydrogenase